MAGRGDAYGPIRAVLLSFLGALGGAAEGSPREFYDRLCLGVCELTPLTRCALLLYDEREKRVRPAGNHGIDEATIHELHGTLGETPIAAQALAEDRVVISSDMAASIAPRHRELPGVREIACVPVAAKDRWLGVMLCDRGGLALDLDPANRDLMWAVGKTAALAASTRIGFEQRQRAKLLAERVTLARDVHDSVIQRLFGLSLVLDTEGDLGTAERRRAADELRSAIDDLRSALQRTGDPPRPAPSSSLHEECERLLAHYPDLKPRLRLDADPPPDFEPLAQSVLAEALHNIGKHAAATDASIETTAGGDAFKLEISNDGAPSRVNAGGGVGLKLAALDAIQKGGVLEFGPYGNDRWRVRLVLPMSTVKAAT